MATEGQIPPIDPKGPEYVYVVIADHIAARIERGELKSGERLPSEVDLAATYSVARMTAHRAMIELRNRGLIKTLVGKGSFVDVQSE